MDQIVFLSIAKETGNYLIDSEWTDVKNNCEFDLSTFDVFLKGIKGHQYYNALVLSCQGKDDEINRQLQEDYEELKEIENE